MQSSKASPFAVLLYWVSKQEISDAVVLEADPCLLQRLVHGELAVVLNPSAAGKRLLSMSMTKIAIVSVLDNRGPQSQSPSIMDRSSTIQFDQDCSVCVCYGKRIWIETKRQRMAVTVSCIGRSRRSTGERINERKSFFFQCPGAVAPKSTGGVIVEWNDPVANELEEGIPTQCSVNSFSAVRRCACQIKHTPRRVTLRRLELIAERLAKSHSQDNLQAKGGQGMISHISWLVWIWPQDVTSVMKAGG